MTTDALLSSSSSLLLLLLLLLFVGWLLLCCGGGVGCMVGLEVVSQCVFTLHGRLYDVGSRSKSEDDHFKSQA